MSDDGTTTLKDLLRDVETDPDTQRAPAVARDALRPRLRKVLDALLVEHFNQTRAARRLMIHRNTIRRLMLEIRDALKGRGFGTS